MPTYTLKPCPKPPSFSSSLLDAIYRSTDESIPQQTTRNNEPHDDVESLRRAIMIEKWIQTYTATSHHIPSNSTSSSTDSSLFSSSETDSSASKTSPKSSLNHKAPRTKALPLDTPPKRELERLAKAKRDYSKKKPKDPISPGAKISNFFNSIFSPRSSSFKTTQCVDEWSSIRKSRSMKDDATTCNSLAASRSCLTKNASSRGSKSKRSVRFCPVSTVIVDDSTIYSYKDECSIKNVKRYEARDCHRSEDRDLDDLSCASSDLFELENIGRVQEELPVYETTSSLELNHRM